MIKRIAMISMHTCPLAELGGRDAGGLNVYVREVAREFGRRGVCVDVFTRHRFASGPSVVYDGPGVRVIHLDAGPVGPLRKEELAAHVPEFAANIDAFRQAEGRDYDVIHAHYWLSGLVAADLKARWGVPALVMFHTLARVKNMYLTSDEEPDSDLRAQGEQTVMTALDTIIAANTIERDHILQRYSVGPGKVVVAPLGVDTTLFSPRDRAAARSELGLGSAPIVFSVGRFDPLKGMDTLIEVAALLAADPRLPVTPRVLIGGGQADFDDPAANPEGARLARLVDQLDVAEYVRFLGPLPQTTLPAYYSAADVVVVPSHYESFGLVAVEAMACGAVVVASNVGGLALSVQDGKTGYLVPARDAGAFAGRIARVLSDPILAQQLRAAAAREGQRYSWQRTADRLFQIYDHAGATASCQRGCPTGEREYATVCDYCS